MVWLVSESAYKLARPSSATTYRITRTSSLKTSELFCPCKLSLFPIALKIPDGINRMIMGRFGSSDELLCLIGGRSIQVRPPVAMPCSITRASPCGYHSLSPQGFDQAGVERYFNVAGDTVSSMCFCDLDRGELQGRQCLLVGSDDCNIRVFKNEEVLATSIETDKV